MKINDLLTLSAVSVFGAGWNFTGEVGITMSGNELATEMAESGDKDTFVIHLMRGTTGVVKVTSVELILTEMRNRYSFKAGQQIEDVFSVELASKVQSALTSIRADDRLISMPEFEVSTNSVLLSGLRILITRLEDGAEAIMLRFRHYIGAIKSAFKFDPAMAVESSSMREKIAVEVLRDIVTPLFDVVAFSRTAPSQDIDRNFRAIEQRLGRIYSRQDEINFYIGLLQRYVAGCRTDALERDKNAHEINGSNQAKIAT